MQGHGRDKYFEGSDCQWLSNGYAAYAVYNLPKLTKDVIFTLFDIPKDKQNGFRITENDSLLGGLNFDDVDKYETPLKYVGRQFADGKKTLLPLQGSLGLIVIDTKFLKPFSGMSEATSCASVSTTRANRTSRSRRV